jgi:hypothetical protein
MSRGLKYQNDNIFFTKEPSESDLKIAFDVHKIRHILSLDRTVATRVAERLKLLGYDKLVKHTIHHISPGSPAGEGQILFDNIRQFLSDRPVLIHCLYGQDRTGFALAAWLIKEKNYNPCQAVSEVENVTGYGKGITPVAKQTLNNILGCYGDEEERELTNEEVEGVVSGETNISDLASADDAVSIMRDNFGQTQGGLSSGTTDAGPIADNLQYQIYHDPNDALVMKDNDYKGIAINTASKRASRIKLLNRIIVAQPIDGSAELHSSSIGSAIPGFTDISKMKDVKDLEQDFGNIIKDIEKVVDSFEQDKKDKLKKKEKEKKEEEIPENMIGAGNVGTIDNYTGVGGNMFSAPSGTPGAGNAAQPVESTGYVQI